MDPSLCVLRRVEQRRHDLRPVRAELDAFHPVGRGPRHPRPRRVRRVHRAVLPTAAGALEVDQPGRHDLVAVAALALGERQLVLGERHADDGGDAVRQPQLERIFAVGVLRRATRVLVQADESRQHVHAGGVDLVLRILRRPLGLQRQAGRAGAAHRGDPVLLDDDVDRPDRRSAGTVDEDGAAQDQRLERTEPFVGAARRGAVQRLACRGRCIRCRVLCRRQRGTERDRRAGQRCRSDRHEISSVRGTILGTP